MKKWNVDELFNGGYENLPKEYIMDVIKAFNDGQKLEARNWGKYGWYDVSKPNFDFTDVMFRVKDRKLTIDEKKDVIRSILEHNRFQTYGDRTAYSKEDYYITFEPNGSMIDFKFDCNNIVYDIKDMTDIYDDDSLLMFTYKDIYDVTIDLLL